MKVLHPTHLSLDTLGGRAREEERQDHAPCDVNGCKGARLDDAAPLQVGGQLQPQPRYLTNEACAWLYFILWLSLRTPAHTGG